MIEANKSGNGESMLRSILHTAKKNVFLIVAIVIIALGLGGVCSVLIKPVYTATQKIIYVGSSQVDSSITNDYNAMKLFVGTIVDFCDEEVVVDRANFYYISYVNKRTESLPNDPSYNLDKFLAYYTNGEEAYDPEWQIGQQDDQKEILKKNISVIAELKTGGVPKYIFSIRYSDLNRQAAIDKVNLLAYAIDAEINLKKEVQVGESTIWQNIYFEGLDSEITNLGTEEVTSSISVARILIISLLVGIIIASLVVYLKTAFDNAVKTKEELETITGASVFAFISNIGGKQNEKRHRK